MKAYLIYDFLTEYGGIERLMVNHARMLKNAGVEVEILTCHYDSEVLKKMDFGDLKVRNISRFKTKNELISLISCFLGFNHIKEFTKDANVIISYSFPSNFLIRNVKKNKIDFMNHVPRFLYFTSKERKEWASSTQGLKRPITAIISVLFNKQLKNLDKKLVLKNKAVFSNSEFTKNKIDPIYGINSIVSYPPVDPVFKEAKDKIKKKFILCSGRIIPDKRFDWLINSVSLMKNKLPLYLTGQYEEDYKKELENLAKEKKVELKFLGRLTTEELVKYYSSAELFAFPVPLCDYGLVPIECMSCGIPVILWGDGGGQTELVSNGESGYYAKPYDFADFARKMDLCLDSNFKKKNKKKILSWVNKFSAKSVERNFVREVKKFLN